ncbi:hypothetical protein ACFRQM_32910 [Streptomyces sp. NPDC056831]|uniref:hypothetical protein n=1 Tax=Streptomyces sp. NPDC056831 TaxID=3345954 RepID=UPI00367ECEEE
MADHMAELEAETAKLIRWHHEDGAALAKTQRAVDHLADRYRGAEAAIERARKLATQPGSTGLTPVDRSPETKKCLVTCDDWVSLGPHQARSARHFRDAIFPCRDGCLIRVR